MDRATEALVRNLLGAVEHVDGTHFGNNAFGRSSAVVEGVYPLASLEYLYVSPVQSSVPLLRVN
jgi:hypothetical protein